MLSTIKEHVKHNFFQIQDYFSTHFCTDKYTPVTDSLENFIADIYDITTFLRYISEIINCGLFMPNEILHFLCLISRDMLPMVTLDLDICCLFV